MTVSSRRSEYTALSGLAVSILFFIIALLISRISGSFAIFAFSFQMLAAVLIWFMLLVQFHQRSLAEQERLDIDRMSRGRQGDTIFETENIRPDILAVAGRRLEVFERWFIPIFGALIAIYQLGIGIFLFTRASGAAQEAVKDPTPKALFMVLISFFSFLIGRYAAGMSSQEKWRPLRGGASYLTACAIVSLILAIGLGMSQFKYYILLNIMSWAVPVVLIILGGEGALNSILDIYRPRIKGHEHRNSFDSRLLGMFSEPGGFFHTAASALDYQFGFKISQTWFYKLFERAIVPLVLLCILVLYGLSCIEIVEPDEQVIIERFGNPINGGEPIGPGFIWKLPWPADKVYREQVGKVRALNVGFVPKENQHRDKTPLLWGKDHYASEDSLLVGSEITGRAAEEGAAPVSIVVTAMRVHYKINDFTKWLYENKSPEKLLGELAYRELTRYAASAKIETEVISESGENGGAEKSLLAAGRAEASEALKERIQAVANKMDLGVEITFTGLEGVHPHKEVAAAFQAVVGAVQAKQAEILSARADRNQMLASLAGSVEEAEQLYALASEYQQKKRSSEDEDIGELEGQLDEKFTSAKGEIFEMLSSARAYAFDRAISVEAEGKRFDDRLRAYYSAPEIYPHELRASVVEQVLPDLRKYILLTDPNDAQILIFDVKDKLVPSLYDIGTGEEN